MVHIFRSESDRDSPFHFFEALIREFGKGRKNGKSHSYWLDGFNRKMSFHFRRVFPLICDRSVWHKKAPSIPIAGRLRLVAIGVSRCFD